ncbi:tyrosine-type recombinase/integrase [Maritalea porphyrae]|uniref:tyrosine-type recombinase/integrase n=1 Tax=Maritalea porphyrae TaxID=880732 RepID=UPI0022AFBA79|nr:site-specific integrase [Maritalea porphyrae]MCZ4274028.1 site-specific integrase [Maritalea porphyrae]
MPAAAKGPYLWFRKERRDKQSGRIIANGLWIIIDNKQHIATGCTKREVERAQEKLRQYSELKYDPRKKKRDIDHIGVADVLSIYLTDKNANIGRIQRLNEFWGNKALSDVNGETCRAYVKHRGTVQGARRDLEDLRSAINHHAKQGLHRELVMVALPPRNPSKDRWLSRSEIARLLWTCLTYHEVQRGKKTKKRPLRHLARFILIAYYTGTRHSAVLTASFMRGKDRSFIDLEAGLFYRLAEGKNATNKRQTPVPIPPRLLAHLKRWNRTSDDYVVQFKGKPLASVKNAFGTCAELAGIQDITPHTLRHSTATHLMQRGVDKWEAAGFLGMSIEMLDRVYGHHHPSYMRAAAAAL